MTPFFKVILFSLSIVSLSAAIMSGDDKAINPQVILSNYPYPSLQTSIQNQPSSRHMIITSTASHVEVTRHPVFARETPCHLDNDFNCSSPRTSEVKQCGLNSRLVGESCMCNQGYRKFPFSELCVRVEGQPCQFQQNDCYTDITYMSCINQVCMCDNSDLYDQISMRCVGKVGGMCFPGVKDCVTNAECGNVPSNLRVIRSPTYYQLPEQMLSDQLASSGSDIELSGTCQCKEGFVESRGGLCKKTYGLPCKLGDECDSLNLICKEGICTCPDSLHIYDGQSQSCVAVVGATCSDESGGNMCVKFASCVKTNLELPGRCQCSQGALETDGRTCMHAIGPSTVPVQSPSASSNLNDNRIEDSRRILFEN